MKLKPAMTIATKTAIKLIAAHAVFIMATGHLYAQQVYKSVDKQGRVTFSEIPPSAASGESLTGALAGKAGDANPSLPYALQQTVSRYPVTLYTGNDCAPCISARLLLSQRGVPFTERTVNSNEDNDVYKRLNSDGTLPMATIATQQLKGFEPTEWNKYLDAAGYPQTSALPRNYNNPAATPLATPLVVKKAAEKSSPVEKPPAAVGRPAPADKGNNPAGIRF